MIFDVQDEILTLEKEKDDKKIGIETVIYHKTIAYSSYFSFIPAHGGDWNAS